jgi:hypothetical protein
VLLDLAARVWSPIHAWHEPAFSGGQKKVEMRATLVGNRYHFFRQLSENTAHRTRVRRQNVEDQAKENKKIKSEDDGPRVRPAVKTMCEAFKPPPRRECNAKRGVVPAAVRQQPGADDRVFAG